MVLKHTIVFGADNSGCSEARVIQVYTSSPHTQCGWLIRVTLKYFDKRRKLQPKKQYKVIPLNGNIRRKSGLVFNCTRTLIVMMTDNMRKLLGTRIYGATMKEVNRTPVEKSILQKIRSYAYYTM